jgi:hypothetical protein
MVGQAAKRPRREKSLHGEPSARIADVVGAGMPIKYLLSHADTIFA